MSHSIEAQGENIPPQKDTESFQPFLLRTFKRSELIDAIDFFGDHYFSQKGKRLDEVFQSIPEESEREDRKLAFRVLQNYVPNIKYLRSHYKFNVIKIGPNEDDIKVEPVTMDA